MLYLIDKTAVPEQAIKSFPALYIEGAAASGKSMTVQMMLKKHPKITNHTFFLDKEKVRMIVPEKLRMLLEQVHEGQRASERWFVFENMSPEMPEELTQSLISFVRDMPENWKAIFISREQPPEVFLDLIWKRQMEIIPQRELLLSPEEIRKMTEQAESPLSPEELYRVTGGWAGCVDTMIRLSAGKSFQSENTNVSADELRRRYEIDTYIQEEILNTLSEQEQKVLELGNLCPWINEDMCIEICGLDAVHGILTGLERKGLLIWLAGKKCWKAAPLFSGSYNQDFSWGEEISSEIKAVKYDKALEDWYEKHGFLKEALWYYRRFSDEKEYCACLLRHYDKIPFLGISYTEILKYRDRSPQAAYLRGMCYRASGNFRKMSQEAASIGPEFPEIYLNLRFADPELSLDEWLELAENLSRTHAQSKCRGKFHLFEMLGSSHTYLCGMRDLSGLFACTKKEENRKAHIWKTVFGEAEWRAYCLARINYYLETERGNALHEEDAELLSQIVQPTFLQKIRKENSESDSGIQKWKNGISGLYLCCLQQMIQPDEARRNKILQLADALRNTENPVCLHNTEAVMGISAYILGNQENLGRWLLTDESKDESEMTCTELVFRIRGYLMLHQYGKADRLLQKTIPYLKKYRLTSLYAEALFQQSIVNWHMEQHGQALQNVIESFLINGSCRYVAFYTIYGNVGVEVLEAYIEWMQNNLPGGWKRKKKYNYGNVLRMPVEDYMNVILKKAKRSAQKESVSKVLERGESLTMMETIVLQAICQGLSNAEISEQQNLKITTVKSHIYSMYKKLGVKNRMQASLKGKELGIV